MKKIVRLQTKIMVAILSAVILFTAAQGILFFTVVERLEDDITNEWVELVGNALIEKVQQAPESYVHHQKIELLPNLTMWIGTAPGLAQEIVPLSSGIHELDLAGEALHIYISEALGEKVWIVYDASTHEKKVTLVAYVMLSIFVLCILLAWVASRKISVKVLNTFDIVLKYIRHWGKNHPSNGWDSDESSKVLQSFDSLEKHLSQLFLIEQQTMANINHEIRGFLTHIRMEAELITTRPSLEQAHIRARKIIEKVDDVNAMMSVLLGQKESRQSLESMPEVVYMIQDLWDMLCFIHEGHALPHLKMVEKSPPEYRGDRHALLLIIRNILDNVITHAQATQLEIELYPQAIVIKDNGIGLPFSIEDLKEHHWKRSDTNSQETQQAFATHGIGLSIAYTVALKNQWKLMQISAPESPWKTVIRIEFEEL